MSLYLSPSMISCFILVISFLISRRISCFSASSCSLVAPPPPEASPFTRETSRSFSIDPNLFLAGLGLSEPELEALDERILLLSPAGEELFSSLPPLGSP